MVTPRNVAVRAGAEFSDDWVELDECVAATPSIVPTNPPADSVEKNSCGSDQSTDLMPFASAVNSYVVESLETPNVTAGEPSERANSSGNCVYVTSPSRLRSHEMVTPSELVELESNKYLFLFWNAKTKCVAAPSPGSMLALNSKVCVRWRVMSAFASHSLLLKFSPKLRLSPSAWTSLGVRALTHAKLPAERVSAPRVSAPLDSMPCDSEPSGSAPWVPIDSLC